MRYVTARLLDESRDLTYRIYVTDCLKALADGNIRYIDLIQQQKKKVETRTSNEIVNDIKQGLMKIGG